jgi:hypothetical protein
MELDASGKIRWEMSGLQYPMSAQVLGNDRVLSAEQTRNRVVEMDTKGKVLWEKPVNQAFVVFRSRNGNTYVAGRNQVTEFDRAGKQLYTINVPSDTIMAAQKFKDGTSAYLTYQGNYHRLDANGKEIKTFRVPYDLNFGMSGAEVLPNDHVLIAVNQLNKVTEYDDKGKAVLTINCNYPGSPTRLPNGNTLITTYNYTRITEVDRNGKVVSETKDIPYRPWKAYRR